MTILSDLSTRAVDHAAESNFLGFMDLIQLLDGAEIYRGADMVRVATPAIPHPLFNLITQTRLNGSADRAIQDAMTSYTARDIPFLWQIEGSTKPDDLGQKLEAHGMKKLGNLPILFADLTTITETLSLPEGFEIKRVDTAELLDAFNKPLAAGFHLPDNVVNGFRKLIRYDEKFHLQNYVGFFNGEPVSASSTMYAGGIAGFYNGTVSESVRGKGFGTASTLHRIHEARKRGYRVGFMVSGGNAYNLFARLGFRACTPWSRYLWQPAPADAAQ